MDVEASEVIKILAQRIGEQAVEIATLRAANDSLIKLLQLTQEVTQ